MDENQQRILQKWIDSGIVSKLPKFVTPDCLKDRDFVLGILRQTKLRFPLLPLLPKAFCKDAEVVAAAIANHGPNMAHMDPKLHDDKEVMIAAVRNDGHLLQYASPRLKDDRDVVLAALENYPYALTYSSGRFGDDREIALVNPVGTYSELSEELRADPEIAKKALEGNPYKIKSVPASLTNDREFAKFAFTLDPIGDTQYRVCFEDLGGYLPAIAYFPDSFRADKELALIAVSGDPFSYYFVSEELKLDEEVFLAALARNYDLLKDAPKGIRSNVELMRKVILNDARQVSEMPVMLRKDKEFIQTLLEKGFYDAYRYADVSVKNDPEIVLLLARKNISSLGSSAKFDKGPDGYVLDYYFDGKAEKRAASIIAAFSSAIENKEFREQTLNSAKEMMRHEYEDVHFQIPVDETFIKESLSGKVYDGNLSQTVLEDRDFAKILLRCAPDKLRLLPEKMRDDKELALLAVSGCGSAFASVSERLKGDKEVLLAALSSKEYPGAGFRFASPALRDDEECARRAIEIDNLNLEHASKRLRGHKAALLPLIAEKGYFLRFLDESLRGDKEVVLAAVNARGAAIEFASPELRADVDVASAALKNERLARKFIPQSTLDIIAKTKKKK